MRKLFLVLFALIFKLGVANSFAIIDTNFQSSSFTEGKDYYYLNISFANIKKEDISATVNGGILLIEAKKDKKQIKNTFSLPFDAEVKGIQAKYSDGVLTFKIKKIKERKEAEIKINIE